MCISAEELCAQGSRRSHLTLRSRDRGGEVVEALLGEGIYLY